MAATSTHGLRGKAPVFGLALVVLVVVVGGAFLAGYLIGRILL